MSSADRLTSHVVARASDIKDGERRIVSVRGRTYGVFNVGGTFHALLNRCPHQGAPLCTGPLVMRIEAQAPGRVRFDEEELLLQCPWHGWEFDLATGRSRVDPDNARVRAYRTEIESGDELARRVADGQVELGAAQVECTVTGGVHNSVVSVRRQDASLSAETVPLSIEDDYVVLHLRR